MTDPTQKNTFPALLEGEGLSLVRRSSKSQFWGNLRDDPMTIRVNDEGADLVWRYKTSPEDMEPIPFVCAHVDTPKDLQPLLENWVQRVHDGE